MPIGVGDIVRVTAGGGTQLLVVDLKGDKVVCAWRRGDGKVCEASWPAGALTRLSGPTWRVSHG